MPSIEPILIKTQKASAGLRRATEQQLQGSLHALADLLVSGQDALLRANARDLARQSPDNPRNDRLLLNPQRIQGIADSIRKVAALPDPSGRVLEHKTLPNGLDVEKLAVPLGVVGAIYESRPNVTFDIAALCLRSRNACVLKGSSDADASNKAAIKLIHAALAANNIPPDAVTLLPSDRSVVQSLLGATRFVDVLIPRGSDALIKYVRKHSLVPVIETGAGVCHLYVHEEADLAAAVSIAVNAKVSRPSVCNAIDCILVDKAIAPKFLERLKEPFAHYGVEIRADPTARRLLKGYPLVKPAGKKDFSREWLSLKIAVRVVTGFDAALSHIAHWSTKHSEAIVSRNKGVCERWLSEVDAATVYANASTRFTDGEALGLGAEIGISTQKLHARGPFALEKLVTEKWIIRGTGQIR